MTDILNKPAVQIAIGAAIMVASNYAPNNAITIRDVIFMVGVAFATSVFIRKGK